VVVAGPIRAIPELFRAIAQAAPDGCIVTDVASVKAQVLRWAEELLPERLRFVGGHPMAGKELQGVAAADATLLRGATYCLAPRDADAVPAVKAMVETLQARPLMVDADAHDQAVAAASHLPFIAATALVRAVAGELGALAGRVASTGFRDTTRVALASPEMHADICNFNAEPIGALIDRLIAELGELKSKLRQPDIEQAFIAAADLRARFPLHTEVAKADDHAAC
jgi:prephenate dehydrogenase